MSESMNRLLARAKQDTVDTGDVSFESLFEKTPLTDIPFSEFSGKVSPMRIKAALEGFVDNTGPYVEREEFDKHVIEDMAEHASLADEVRQLKAMSGAIGEADDILGSVAVAGSEQPAAVVISHEAMKSIARELDIPAPAASMESIDGWVSKLKNFLRSAVANYGSAGANGVIRPIKSLLVVNANLAKVRQELDKLEYRDGIDIMLDINTANSLLIGNKLPGLQDLAGAVAGFVETVVEVHLAGTDNYLLSVDAIRRGLADLAELPESDEEFEAVLKKVASMVHSPDMYYEIEPGTTTYPGNVKFKRTDFAPARNYPQWFEPVLRMDSAPFFEMEKTKVKGLTTSYTLSTTELGQLLTIVEVAIEHLYDADKRWVEKVAEMHRVCREAIAKAEKWSSEDMAKYSVINKRMLDIAMKNMLLMPVVLSQPTTVLINPLIDTLYAMTQVVSMAVKKAK